MLNFLMIFADSIYCCWLVFLIFFMVDYLELGALKGNKEFAVCLCSALLSGAAVTAAGLQHRGCRRISLPTPRAQGGLRLLPGMREGNDFSCFDN